MIVEPFKRQHLKDMVIQQRQQNMLHLLDDSILAGIESSNTKTFRDGDEILACIGEMPVAAGRAVAWAYISSNIGSRMVTLTKKVRRLIASLPYRRIEMDVDCEFEQAHRWARLLGFEMECERRKSFTPDGRDCALYALVR